MATPTKTLNRGKSEIAGIRSRNLLDSRRLFYFFHVARLGSVSAAEAVLDIAQSALTRQIQQLECEVGEQLMQRTGRGMALTPAGEILYRQAQNILQDMAVTLKLIEHSHDEEGAQLTIASPPSFSSTVMPEVVTTFLQRHPEARLTAYESSTDQVYDLLASGEADVAVVMHEATSRKLALQKIAVESLMVVMGPTHPWAQRKSITREELPQLEMMTGVAIHGSRAALETYCAEGGVTINARLRMDSLGITRAVLRENRFCTVISPLSCAAELASGELVALPLVPRLRRTVYLARLAERPQTKYMRALAKEVADAARLRYGETR